MVIKHLLSFQGVLFSSALFVAELRKTIPLSNMSSGVGFGSAGRLYPESVSKFDEKLFQTPTSHYRGAPLWSWNCKLDIEQLEEQIGHLKEMGMGGAHIHSRTGLDDEYLGTHFFEAVKASIKKSKEKGMLTWL